MAFPPFVRQRIKGETVSAKEFYDFQQTLERPLQRLIAAEANDSQVISDVILTGGSTTWVPHTLGRPWIGWYVADKNQNGDVWSDSSCPADKSKFLALGCSVASIKVRLVVF